MKKKRNDVYYRRYLRQSIGMSVGLIIVGLLFVFLIAFMSKIDIGFLKNTTKTKAEIIDVKYKSGIYTYGCIDVEKTKYVVIKYIVNNVDYTQKLRSFNSSMYLGKKIDIYYNTNNPAEFISGDFTFYFIGILVCIPIIITGCIGSIFEIKKIIRYIETLKGIEIKADIVRVITIPKPWGNRYKIECIGKDEAGEQRTFYSREFIEPYLEAEIKKNENKNCNSKIQKI